MICLNQKPSLKIMKEGKGEKQIVSSFPTPQVREEGRFWKYILVFMLEVKMESSLILKIGFGYGKGCFKC